ncbi:MAG: hypothetical protein WCK35_29755, partial [Chloroflexota bacterium]
MPLVRLFRLEKIDPLLEKQVQQGMLSVARFFFWVYVVSFTLWSLLWLMPSAPRSHITRASASYNYGLGDLFLLVVGLCEAAYLWFLRRAIRISQSFPRLF